MFKASLVDVRHTVLTHEERSAAQENVGLECMRDWARAAAESKPGYGLCLHSKNSGGRHSLEDQKF